MVCSFLPFLISLFLPLGIIECVRLLVIPIELWCAILQYITDIIGITYHCLWSTKLMWTMKLKFKKKNKRQTQNAILPSLVYETFHFLKFHNWC